MKPKPTHAGVHRTEVIMKYRISRTFTLVAALTALCASQDAVAQQVDRTVLPIPEPQPPVVTELSARDVSPPARFDVKAPQAAPNVVVVRWTTSASASRAPSAARSRCRLWTSWRPA